jgi:predicted Zn-dependent protease
LVQAYQAAGQAEAAAAHLDALVEAKPDNTAALVLLADTDYGLARTAKAERALRQAIAARPDWPAPYLKLASLYIKESRLADARTAIEDGLARNPDQRDLLINLGLTEEALGNFEAARKAYERLLQEDPHELVAANNLAALIADVWSTDAQLMDQARRLAEPFRNSGDALLLDTLGWIQLRLGNVADATALLERAAAALPEHQQIRYHLGMAYRAQGDDKRAKDELAKAVAGTPDFRGIDDAKKTLGAL